MITVIRTLAVLLLVLLWPASRSVLAGEAAASESVREGWAQVRELPAWVRQAPPRDGALRLVDGAQSNLPSLAYPEVDSAAAVRNVRLMLLVRLAPVLGVAARGPADAGAKAATAAEKAIHVHRKPARGMPVPGGTTCSAFVLWDVPLAPLVAEVPVEKRAAVSTALTAPPLGRGVAWRTVTSPPRWASRSPKLADPLQVATTHAGPTWDLVEAMAEVGSWSMVRYRIQTLLRPLLGGDRAFEIGVMASGSRRLVERVRLEDGRRAWQLWEVDVDDILAYVPEEHREAARAALEPAAAPGSGSAPR